MKTLLTAAGVLVTWFISSTAPLAQSFSVSPISVPGSVSLAISALNNSGEAAGYFSTATSPQRAFFWANGVGLDVGTLGGSVSVANSLNNFSQLAGYSSSVDDTEYHAFAGIGRTLFDLGTLGGPVSTANWISDAGHTTGYSFIAPGSLDAHAFLMLSGDAMMRDLGTLGGSSSFGVRVNNAGQVTGDSTTGDNQIHAFLYTGGTLRDLGTLGGLYSSASALNEVGQVTGESNLAGDPDPELHAFLFDGTMLRDLGTLGGTYSTGYQINNAGQVIGDSQTSGNREYHGFLFANGAMTDLGTLGGGYSSAWGLNNSGQVVGVSSNAAGQDRAFLWQNGVLSDLNSLLPAGSGWELTAAYFINDNGQIAGTGRWQGQEGWYLLTPRPGGNQQPVASAGPDQTVDLPSLVTLDGRASSDPDGDELRYAWFEGDVALGTGATLTVSLPLGSHTITLRVTDPYDASAEDTVVVNVVDRSPPQIHALTADPCTLSPINRQMVPVTLTAIVTDNTDPKPRCRIVCVTSSDPPTSQADNTAPDWNVTGDLTVELRAEVAKEPERVYTIRVACTDAAGNTSHSEVCVRASRNNSR